MGQVSHRESEEEQRHTARTREHEGQASQGDQRAPALAAERGEGSSVYIVADVIAHGAAARAGDHQFRKPKHPCVNVFGI